jgi:YD repeat-containing protein
VALADAVQNRRNTITWTYDDDGNLTSVVDHYSAYTYTYDQEAGSPLGAWHIPKEGAGSPSTYPSRVNR